jgi:2,4-dienoyl-CoA reductase-like NADH-dependent reductase (Old Yellow Enzyme family)
MESRQIACCTISRMSALPSSFAALFEPLDLGSGLVLPNRVVLAPCTRNRASIDLGPSEGAAQYYAERADAGLLITEAVLVTREAQGYLDTPGLFADSHVPGWARVCDAVHARGGRIFAQLWHTGRIAHSHWAKVQPVAPSAVLDPVLRRQAGGVELYNEMPRELSAQEIPAVIDLFRQAATRARQAGFDGVEIHGANGYLIEQFLRQHTNCRKDDWGGSLTARLRFALAVVQACLEVWGPHRVGLRLSPFPDFGEMRWTEGDNETYVALLQALQTQPLAYVHTGITQDTPHAEIDGTPSQFLRRHWPDVLMGNGGYTPEAAHAQLAAGEFDLISFGRRFIANPDLVQRLQQGQALRDYHHDLLKELR